MAQNSNPKPFWHYVHSKRKTNSTIGPLIKLSEDGLAEGSQECAQVLSDYFSTVFTAEDLDPIPFAVPKTFDELVDMEFTEELVARNLSVTSNYSSTGPDDIPYIALKAGGSLMIQQLCRLFQLCFDSCLVPSQWKTAYITPVFKSGNRTNPSNYRPVSLICCACKLMESCIREVIWNFWTERSLINASQFGFTPLSSSTIQLLKFMEDLTSAVDSKNWTDVVYLDFSKAFNSVPHNRLL